MELTKETFTEKVLNAKGKVLVDFYADWCNPCKMLAGVLKETEKQVKDVTFYKVNIDKEPELSIEYKVMSIPALALFKDGELINSTVGYMEKDELLEFLNE